MLHLKELLSSKACSSCCGQADSLYISLQGSGRSVCTTTVSSGTRVLLVVLDDVGAQWPSWAVRVGRRLVVDMRPVMGYSKRCEFRMQDNVNPLGTAGTQKESEAARDTHPVQRGSRWAGLVGF